MTPAVSAVTAATCGGTRGVAVDVRRALAEDERVQDDDVGHRHEGHEAAAHLARDGGAAPGDLEVPVQAAAGFWLFGGLGGAGGDEGTVLMNDLRG